jgi:hypothetical protein
MPAPTRQDRRLDPTLVAILTMTLSNGSSFLVQSCSDHTRARHPPSQLNSHKASSMSATGNPRFDELSVKERATTQTMAVLTACGTGYRLFILCCYCLLIVAGLIAGVVFSVQWGSFIFLGFAVAGALPAIFWWFYLATLEASVADLREKQARGQRITVV